MSYAKDIVLQAAGELFGDKDATAVDRWATPDYRQHSAMAADGAEGLRVLVSALGPDFRYEPARVITDGDTVALHGTYRGFGPKPLVGFDIFRVQDGKLAEHWDALQPQADTTVSGRSETDGPTEVDALDQTEPNRALVTAFVQNILQGGKVDTITDYISTERYHQHNPLIGDGLEGLGAALAAFAEQGIDMVYDTVHKVVAEGSFVLTVSEGRLGSAPTAFYDLFRVENGKIVEHWDATPPIPAPDAVPHSNSLF
ncbi:Predicted SnoaL-like aldol condensation-catalyzing enzyme [Nonomuraea solani]|uniref:Predicted SnoaL-like aldol condensation-catalyzing enzyme n=1 Tax=Nonomuraea solani TaxID=1144553 RepID=A0A1H6EH11_9ACTN|nr:nuclear transport factor 2 family protein [Nonomuraea solani]SEG96095.1 Predicted SnoaL-like aldol condensation-catalyzing enzyme [Nonomuraea solani]